MILDVDGPRYNGNQLKPEPLGFQSMLGNDTYSATTNVISGVSNGDRYTCTASNGVEPASKATVELKGMSL